MLYTIPSNIQPDNKDDASRWAAQAQRIRLMEGQHADDVRDDIKKLFAAEIAAEMEISPDLSRNTALTVWQQLATAYANPPKITTEEDTGEDLAAVVTPRLWPIQAQNNLILEALNESIIRIDFEYWNGATEASYRIVWPDSVVMQAHPNHPDKPIRVEWLRYRHTPGEVGAWTWEIWDISDPAAPIFRIDLIDSRGTRTEATAQFSPELDGRYPYYDAEGLPVLPWVLYHKKIGSRLWSYTQGSELVAGAIRLCSLWTNWTEGYLNNAAPVRFALDADCQAGVTRNISGVSVDVVPADRKSILKFQSTGQGGGTLSQFNSGFDPRASAEALEVFEKGLAVYAGLNPSDLQVTGAQSGYAIVVSREGQRRKAREMFPGLGEGDRDLLATAARLSNAYAGTSLPTAPRDYTIEYRGLAETEGEKRERVDTVSKELVLGLLSKPEALRRLNPDITTDAEAVERLIEIQETNRILTNNAPGGDTPETVGE